MQITDDMVRRAAAAIYDRHLATGTIERDDVEIDDEMRAWWIKEYSDDARVALEAALKPEPR